MLATKPDVTVTVLHHVNNVVGVNEVVGRVLSEVAECFCTFIIYEDTISIGRNPDQTMPVSDDHTFQSVGKLISAGRYDMNMCTLLSPSVSVQKVAVSQKYHRISQVILECRAWPVARGRLTLRSMFGLFISQHMEAITIIFIYTVSTSLVEIAQIVLFNLSDVIVGQPVLACQFVRDNLILSMN